ncbi:hypothetical protein POX_d05083 [Penicillium oxalicum]|uniref:hypothetical protein n=1 Tax=Penicillium oxalicum TaxID=69781 RepID=UPI0020B71C4F|nr:hypothetical protein POX_d05083 [Penicillium oxalicum]KAI2789589.1 hypothetical protein POX_d05083 [Penicillium oxalicum]
MVVDDQGARVYASGQTLFKGLMAVYTLSGLQIDLNTTDVHLISFSSNRLENGSANSSGSPVHLRAASSGPVNSSAWDQHTHSHSFNHFVPFDPSFAASTSSSSPSTLLDGISTTSPYTTSYDSLSAAHSSTLWTEPCIPAAQADWNSYLHDLSIPLPSASALTDDLHVAINGNVIYDIPQPPSHGSLSDLGSQDSCSPVLSLGASPSSSSTSPRDESSTHVDRSRIEKRRLNALAARRCRQRRVDRMKDLEDELEAMRKERDDLKLKVSRLEGETEALKGLLSRKSG